MGNAVMGQTGLDLNLGITGSSSKRRVSSAWQQVYDQAVADNWFALYDPSNPNTRVTREDAATGVQYVEGILDALGNRTPILQATATAQPWLAPEIFGALDGLNHAGDDTWVSAGASKARWLTANAADWLDVPAPWTKLIMFRALNLGDWYHTFLAPNYIASNAVNYEHTWTFRVAGNTHLYGTLADFNSHIFTGIHQDANATDHFYIDSASVGSLAGTVATAQTSWIVGANDAAGTSYWARGYTGVSMIRADADMGAITRMQDLLHQLTTIPKAA